MSVFNSKVASPRVKRNKFDLSHEKKLSLNMGKLVPIFHQEVMPGDQFRVSSEVFLRFAPMLAPIMHRVNVHVHYFFVPNRILWPSWEDFITGGKNGNLEPLHPSINWPAPQSSEQERKEWHGLGSLGDYLGLPPCDPTLVTFPNQRQVNALPFAAYQRIWADYYRDANLATLDESNFVLVDGQNYSSELLKIRNRSWEKDYFTTALPWAQRLQNPAKVPLDIRYMATSDVLSQGGSNASGALAAEGGDLTAPAAQNARIENIDLFNTGMLIEDLRRTNKLQEWLEASARFGSRYIEQIYAHFKVKSSDKRLQRAEYLGGGVQNVVISEVLQTATDAAGATLQPLGQMAGHAISVGGRNFMKDFIEEHGHIMGIMSVLPRTAYQDGLERTLLPKSSKFEYPWPEFAQIGEQEVTDNELYWDVNAGAAQPITTFGYQSRYCEHKYKMDTVHGDFRDSLDYWHLGRKFGQVPVLNEQFVTSDPTHRIFAVQDEEFHKLYCQIYHKVDALRPLPYFNVPQL